MLLCARPRYVLYCSAGSCNRAIYYRRVLINNGNTTQTIACHYEPTVVVDLDKSWLIFFCIVNLESWAVTYLSGWLSGPNHIEITTWKLWVVILTPVGSMGHKALMAVVWLSVPCLTKSRAWKVVGSRQESDYIVQPIGVYRRSKPQ